MKKIIILFIATVFVASCHSKDKTNLTDNTNIAEQIKENNPEYLRILKSADKYDFSDRQYIPKFTYQTKEDENLTRLRLYFNLDSIAGEKDEISKMLNLMHWVHETVKYDGESNNPDSKNAIDLINICKLEDRAINCRMMAIVLNECYLAIGLKSRFITCMPKEKEFSDCHVINAVYSNDLQKWLWMDPTFDAYVTNEKAELLSIAEVREKLILGHTLIVNPEANLNKRPVTKEFYLETYMAKNLYRMNSCLDSKFNVETYQGYKTTDYVELLPLDKKNSLNIYKTADYEINNPDLFWIKPE